MFAAKHWTHEAKLYKWRLTDSDKNQQTTKCENISSSFSANSLKTTTGIMETQTHADFCHLMSHDFDSSSFDSKHPTRMDIKNYQWTK